ncbi:MAG: hypothetical protein MI748_09075 [Opitutales bacterium]|nr:hypothetical protein [Opitutales bacterium]
MISAVITGGVFSYLRFFRGRTLAAKADAELKVSVHDTDCDFYLHSVSLYLKNLGSVSIWDPKPVVQLITHGPDGSNEKRVISSWYNPENILNRDGNVVVDIQETVMFSSIEKIPKNIWAVTYLACVESKCKDDWSTCTTVSNSLNQIEG